MISTRFLFTAISLSRLANTQLLANGGAWHAGVPNTGNGAASDQKKSTDVTIEEENLTIGIEIETAGYLH